MVVDEYKKLFEKREKARAYREKRKAQARVEFYERIRSYQNKVKEKLSPIDICPRDGTKFIGAHIDSADGTGAICWWENNQVCSSTAFILFNNMIAFNPTHWAHLKEEPKGRNYFYSSEVMGEE